MTTNTQARRAVGIIRVSEVGGRDGPSFGTTTTQRERIEQECAREGLRLVAVFEELDVSGGRPLDRRPGLREAVRMLEAGEAEVIVANDQSRLARSTATRLELINRVQAVGGSILVVGAGDIADDDDDGRWIQVQAQGLVDEMTLRETRKRSRLAQQHAIDRGVAPWGVVTPGYKRPRTEEGSALPYVIDTDVAPHVREAFAMRAGGASIDRVSAYLRQHGVDLSHSGVRKLLASKIVLGEIHFGKRREANLRAHPPIVDRDVWDRVQATRSTGGRHAKSERLLARLGVLRCASCDSRMVAASARQGERVYPFYRCGRGCNDGSCAAPATISAGLVEDAVVAIVRETFTNVRGRASLESGRRQDETALERAQVELDGAIAAFSTIDGGAAAVAKLAELQAIRDAARERLAQRGPSRSLTLGADRDWDDLTIDERRALIRATVEAVMVSRGRGLGKLVVVGYSDGDVEAARILAAAARRVLG